jgi:hypothetical protein
MREQLILDYDFRNSGSHQQSKDLKIAWIHSVVSYYLPPFTTNPTFHPHDYNPHHTTQIQHDNNTKHLHTNQHYNSCIYFLDKTTHHTPQTIRSQHRPRTWRLRQKKNITKSQQHSRRKKTLNVIYTIHLCIEKNHFCNGIPHYPQNYNWLVF